MDLADTKAADDEVTTRFDDFNIEGFTQEEIKAYNSIAEPGQRLGDAVTPGPMRDMMYEVLSQNQTITGAIHSTVPSVSKKVDIFVRKHPFSAKVAMDMFTKSERRQSKRDIYDHGDVPALDHTVAEKQIVKAGESCGDEDYDSADSALRHEIRDSPTIFKRLAATSGLEPMVSPCGEIAPHVHQHPQQQSKAKISPKKSPYFASSGTRKTPSRKRKANAKNLGDLKDEGESLERSESFKRRKHDTGAADCNAVELGSVNLPRDQPSLTHPGVGTLFVYCSESATKRYQGNTQNLDITGALMGSVECTKEAADVRKAAKKDRRVRERAQLAATRLSSQKIDPVTNSSSTVAKPKAHDSSPTISQYSTHEPRQTPNALRDGRDKSPDPSQSQTPAPTAPEAPVANATISAKRKATTEAQKAQRRQETVEKEADQAKAAESIEVAEKEVVRWNRKNDEGANILKDGQESKNVTAAPTTADKKGRKQLREFSATQRNQPEGFQHPMI